MYRKLSVMLACAAAGVASSLTTSAKAQNTFVDNFNNGNPLNSDTIPGFFSSANYSAGDASFVTEPVGGPLTLGYNGAAGTQGGPFLYSNVSNAFNIEQAPVTITMNAAPGGNLIPTFDTFTHDTADTYISLGGNLGRADQGTYRFTFELSNDGEPQIIIRDGTGTGIYHYAVYTPTGESQYMPEGNPGSGNTNPVGPGVDVTSMFMYVDATNIATGNIYLNFGETWVNTNTSPRSYGTYTYDEELGLTTFEDVGQTTEVAPSDADIANGFANGSSLEVEVENGGNNFTSNEAVPVGQITDLNTYTWNNNAGSAGGDGKTWDVGGNSNWVNMATAATPANPTSTYADGPASSVEFNDENSGNYAVTLNTTVSPGAVLVSNEYGNYTISGTGKIVDAGEFTKNGQDSLVLGVGLTTPNLTITGGGFVAGTFVPGVTPGTPLTGSFMQLAPGVAGGTGPSATSAITVGALNIDGTSQLDITNNHLIVDYGTGPDPIASIAAMVASGYNGGKWNGAGIISSTAAANPHYGIGYADSADPGNPAALSSGTIEIAYTLLGDANLDGIVNGIDFGILAANFNKGVTGWDKGDFNYDNVVNGIDFGELAANFNKGATGASVGLPAYDDPAILAFASANGLLADVPEPATVGLFLMASAGILARRRKR
jgi:hypothetical protein